MEIGSPEYQQHRHRQLIEAYDRLVASYQNRIHDLEFQNYVLRGNLKALSEAEKRAIDPAGIATTEGVL